MTAEVISACSCLGFLRNFNLAGVFSNSPSTSHVVPRALPHGVISVIAPNFALSLYESSPLQEVICMVLTAAIDAKASPLNPREEILSRSFAEHIFEVACGSMQRVRSSLLIPAPSSDILMEVMPPFSMEISIFLAPASIQFSTSSLTTLAGRSTTSPAAIRLYT